MTASADGCAECARQERLSSADPTEEWVADAWAQATPHPHAGRASAKGPLAECECVPGHAALRSSESDSGLDALPRLRLSGEELDGLGHGLGDEFAVDWDEYDEFVRLDDVRAALSTPRTETSE